MTQRQITSSRAARRAVVANVDTRIALTGPANDDMLDPFLLLAHHGPQDFPPNSAEPSMEPHPHRGFETVTFILDGELAHRDSQGNESLIHAGGVQWLTAGTGVVHSERAPASFWKKGGRFEILQLWVNLPARLKMSPPRYIGVEANDIASVLLPAGAGSLALISGDFAGSTGPVESLTGVFMSTVSLRAGGRVSLPAPSGRCVLFYIVRGEVAADGAKLGAGHLATFGEGGTIDVEAHEDAMILFGHGDVIDEPVVASGPFVMNSEAEIEGAYTDYRAGGFGEL